MGDDELSEIEDFNIGRFFIEPPVYDEDCDMIEICDSIGATYNICYKGAEMIVCKRCSVDTKQQILQQHRAEKLAEKNLENMKAESKKSAMRSWVQLVLAAILGGAVTKLFDLIFSFIL